MKLLEFPTDKAVIDQVVGRAEYAALLIPSPRQAYIEEVCAQAIEYGFAGVLATPFDCQRVQTCLAGSKVETICLNALNHALDENFDSRVAGIDILLEMGVRNFELSAPCGMILDGKFDAISQQLSTMTEHIHKANGRASVILEPDCMSKPDMAQLIAAAQKAGMDYLRICSGFAQICGTNGGRATLNTIGFVQKNRSGDLGIKAGGGWDYAYLEDCAEYIDSGAVRVDVGPRFVEQLKNLGYRRDA